jgi:hypothetical protein
MVKVRDVYGDKPTISINMGSLTSPDPQDIWANYDPETDSMIIYVTGEPVPGVQVYLNNDFYVIVDPNSSDIVGFYIEAWETRYVSMHKEVSESWEKVRESIPDEIGWSHLLRMVALWLVLIFSHSQGAQSPSLQPA